MGIEFLRSSKGIMKNLRKYAFKLITKVGLGTAKPNMTPLECNMKLTVIKFDQRVQSSDSLYEDVPRY